MLPFSYDIRSEFLIETTFCLHLKSESDSKFCDLDSKYSILDSKLFHTPICPPHTDKLVHFVHER